jgi:sulfite exporter TauE/SafE
LLTQILLAFITGLTTGGLSCLAVQGGLLTSSIAAEIEQSVQGSSVAGERGESEFARRRSPAGRKGQPRGASSLPTAQRSPARPPLRAGRPILLFLAAKIVAYTILGFLLGLLGSVLQLTATMRAVLQFAIGIFMIGTALRLFNVHPIFRYFVLQPPAFVTRYIRRTAKGRAGDVTPLFLGALTVLIPCGVTQAMMAVAIGAGNPLTGAAIMLAFTLGASPVFFTVAYLATRLGGRLEAGFMRVVAVLMLVLGLVSVEAGLNLMGSPYSFTNLTRNYGGSESAGSGSAALVQEAPAAQPGGESGLSGLHDTSVSAPAGGGSGSAGQLRSAFGAAGGSANAGASDSAGANALRIMVNARGYTPNLLHARPGQPLQLTMVTKDTYNCARSFVIPGLRVEKILPPTGSVLIDVPPQQAGSKLFFSCSMGMYSGVIVFDG